MGVSPPVPKRNLGPPPPNTRRQQAEFTAGEVFINPTTGIRVSRPVPYVLDCEDPRDRFTVLDHYESDAGLRHRCDGCGAPRLGACAYCGAP